MLRRLALVVVPALLAASCGTLTPASLEFLGAFPVQPRIGESTTLQFLARDERGEPMAGVEVRFSFAGGDPAGVTLSTRTGLTNRGTGIVEVTVSSTRVQSVIVVAEAGAISPDGGQASGEVRVAQSPSITFAGAGSPSARQFTFQCGETAGEGSGGARAIMAYDDTRHLIAGVKTQCIAHVGDRNGDGVPGVVVSFLTEAGTIGPSAISITDVVGNAETLYKTSLPFPKDVDPGFFELNPDASASDRMPHLIAPLWMHPFEWKANPIEDFDLGPTREEPQRSDPVRPGLINNPRDNLVAMIAVTRGEEGFTDVNGNGQFDVDEPFDDLTEPFVDSNDNGTKDADERWVDSDGDGQWDPKNGTHDADTNIWVMERILWTGVPHRRDFDPALTTQPLFRQIGGTPALVHGGSAQVRAVLADPWFNSMAQNGASDGCSAGNVDLVVPSRDRFAGAWLGIALSYPSPSLIDFFVSDAHTDVDPPFAGPVPFVLGIECSFTGSPLDGFNVALGLPITGTVL